MYGVVRRRDGEKRSAVYFDGYIADDSGKVDWLEGQSKEVENKDTYSAFVEGVDTVIMG